MGWGSACSETEVLGMLFSDHILNYHDELTGPYVLDPR